MKTKFLLCLFLCCATAGFAQQDSLLHPVKKGFGRYIMYQNKDTLYTRNTGMLFSLHWTYKFRAYYPGTRIVCHKWILKQSACFDCMANSTKRDWNYDKNGQLTEYNELVRIGSAHHPVSCITTTSKYENGKLVSTTKKDCDDE